MSPNKSTLTKKRAYNLRSSRNPDSYCKIQDNTCNETRSAKSRKKFLKHTKLKQAYSTEDKMIQTSEHEVSGLENVKTYANDVISTKQSDQSDAFSKSSSQDGVCTMPTSQNAMHAGNEPEVRSLSPIPNLSEGDISSLLGILNSNAASSTSATTIQSSAALAMPSSPSPCASRPLCVACSCARAAAWCPPHACTLYGTELTATGCRPSALHQPTTICVGGCLCSGVFRYPLCSTQSPHGPTV